MKKYFISLLVAFVLEGATFAAHGQQIYPIPSSDICVNGTLCFEEGRTSAESAKGDRAKRKIAIKPQCVSGGSQECHVTAVVYSLDQVDVLGPYAVSDEEIFYVEIDDREWGVCVRNFGALTVSVWIE